jgi:hypothetical protein
MYKCIKCFEYESKLNEHKNRKIPCDKINDFNCKYCNKEFKYESDYLRHKKSKKHINNITIENKIILNESNNKYNKELDNKLNKLTNENKSLKLEINHLQNIIELLKIENNELKSKNKLHNELEYIYIIHPIYCINTNIYKIGRSNNVINRHRQYPKGSELLFTITCHNSKLVEQNILNYLKTNDNYIQVKKYGNEYFQCNLDILINDIHNIINNN